MRTFLEQSARADGYDYRRIEAVLDMIIANCVQMREVVADKQLEEG